MSDHSALYGGSVVPTLMGLHGDEEAVEYTTPDGRSFKLTAAVGHAQGVNERDVGGDTSVEWRTVLIRASDLVEQGINTVQAWATVRYQGRDYSVSLSGSSFSDHFVVLKLERHLQLRQVQFRDG
jgi:hypothetical protein